MTQFQQTADTLDLEALFAFVVALSSGDFSTRLPTDGCGRAGEIAAGLNRFMQNTERFLSEITRIANEISDGVLGGQAEVFLAPGPWRNCVEAINVMEYHLTGQIRDMVKSADPAADGKRKVTAPCRGEMDALKQNLNALLEQFKEQCKSASE